MDALPWYQQHWLWHGWYQRIGERSIYVYYIWVLSIFIWYIHQPRITKNIQELPLKIIWMIIMSCVIPRYGIPFRRFQSEAMELYLVWDSESEVTKDGTLLETCMRADDESDDSSPRARKRKKTQKRKRSPSSSSQEEPFFLPSVNVNLQQNSCPLLTLFLSTVAILISTD